MVSCLPSTVIVLVTVIVSGTVSGITSTLPSTVVRVTVFTSSLEAATELEAGTVTYTVKMLPSIVTVVGTDTDPVTEPGSDKVTVLLLPETETVSVTVRESGTV